jgi:hypothetical protein
VTFTVTVVKRPPPPVIVKVEAPAPTGTTVTTFDEMLAVATLALKPESPNTPE